MVKWHQTYGKGPLKLQERGNLLPPHGLLLLINSKGSFICIILCYTSHGALVGIRNCSISPPWGIDPTTDHTLSRCSTTELYLATFSKQSLKYTTHCITKMSLLFFLIMSITRAIIIHEVFMIQVKEHIFINHDFSRIVHIVAFVSYTSCGTLVGKRNSLLELQLQLNLK